ncbi:hypothetical protein [Streptomyces canus]|uniref:hypothetical protein n=1 Tax=Streptomyces canus TaxID=58343 RepID=UPI000AD699E9|nr:hypothetical protein [Streptomyces canus]
MCGVTTVAATSGGTGTAAVWSYGCTGDRLRLLLQLPVAALDGLHCAGRRADGRGQLRGRHAGRHRRSAHPFHGEVHGPRRHHWLGTAPEFGEWFARMLAGEIETDWMPDAAAVAGFAVLRRPDPTRRGRPPTPTWWSRPTARSPERPVRVPGRRSPRSAYP